MRSTKALTWIMIPLIFVFFTSSIMMRVQQDISTDVLIVNEQGATGRALVVYHPGLSSFQDNVMEAYIAGLVDADWSVMVSTASVGAPTSMSDFDLLVLGSPTYAWKPAGPITRYLGRLRELSGLPTALILTGGASTGSAADQLEDAATAAGADVIGILELWQGAPNVEIQGTTDPVEIARQTASELEGL